MATKTKKTAVLATKLLGEAARNGSGPASTTSLMGEAARNGKAQVPTLLSSPVTSVQAGTVPPSYTPSGSNPDQYSPEGIQAAVNALPGYTPVGKVSPYTPSKSAAQRAQDLVNAQYGSKMAGLNSKVGALDQNLAVGQATQDKYAVYGDAKLAQIYQDLQGTTQGIADNIKGVYGDASKAVGASYDAAGNTLSGVSAQAQAMLAAQGNQLGIGQAIPGAAANLNEYVGQQQAQNASDRANSQANIDTLGANMSAAGLKDVANVARYGADNRRDLVMQVQATKAKLQYDHDVAKKDFLDQLSALESEKADALAAATNDNERYDIEQQYQREKDQNTLDFQNATQKHQVDQDNLNNTLNKLNTADAHNQNVVGNQLAQGAQDIQKAQLQDTLTNNAFNRQITAKQLGITEKELDLKIQQFGFEKSQAVLSNALAQKAMDLNWAQLSQQQKEASLAAIRADTSLSLEERRVTAQEMDQISANRARADASITAGVNASAAQTRADIAYQTAINKITPGTIEYATEQAKLTKIKADTDLTNKRIEALSGSTAKYSSLDGFYTANKKTIGPQFKSAVNSILSVALRSGNGVTRLDPVVAAQTLIYSGLDNFVGSNAYGVTLTDLTSQELKDLKALTGKDQGKLMQAVLLALGKK